MSSDAGTIVLGDPGVLLGPVGQQISTQEDIFRTINNNGFPWMTLENRLSTPLWVCPGSSSRPNAGISIPALSLACIPVDPVNDIVVGFARGDDGDTNGMVAGVSGGSGLRTTIRRVLPYTLQSHGGFHIAELYPIRDCLIVSRPATIGPTLTAKFGVGTDTDTPTNIITGGALQNSLFKNAHTPDAVIMRLGMSVRSLGVAALSDIAVTAEWSGNAHSLAAGFSYVEDVLVFGGGTIIPPLPSWVDLPGVNGIVVTNTHATATIVIVVTLYVGMPHDVPISAIP